MAESIETKQDLVDELVWLLNGRDGVDSVGAIDGEDATIGVNLTNGGVFFVQVQDA